MNFERAVARGIGWSSAVALARVAVLPLSYLVTAFLVGPSALGVWAMVAAVVGLCQAVVGDKILESLVQWPNPERGHFDTMFVAVMVASLALAAGATVLVPLAEAFAGPTMIGPYLPWAMIAVPLSAAAAVPVAILKRALRVGALGAATVAGQVAAGLASIALAAFGFGVWSLVAASLVGPAVHLVAVFVLAPWRPGTAVSRRHFRALARYNASVIGIELLGALERNLPAMVIGPTLGPMALGLFAMASRIASFVVDAVMQPILAVAMPGFAHLRNEAGTAPGAFLGLTTSLASLIVFPVCVGLALATPDIAPLVLAGEWAASVVLIQVLAVAGSRKPSTAFNQALLRAHGYPHYQAMTTLIRIVATAILLAVAVRIDLVAAAAAVAVSALLSWPISAALVARLVRVPIAAQLAAVARPAAAAAAMAAVLVLWRAWGWFADEPTMRAVTVTAVGAFAYGAAIAVLGRPVLRRGLALVRAARHPS